MTTATAQERGGQVMAERQRLDALNRYDAHPNHCETCGKVIEVKDGEKVSTAKRKRFCDRACAASHNNRNRKPRSQSSRSCPRCGGLRSARAQLCQKCQAEAATLIATVTKGELKNSRNGYQNFRSAIRQHAMAAYVRSGRPLRCSVCDYAAHVDICHIQAVSAFPDDALISEINSPENLVALCPNHHWEYDHDLLKL